MELLKIALQKYAAKPSEKVSALKSLFYNVLNGKCLDIDERMVVVSDPIEDCDDILMIYYILMKMKNKIWVIISGGLHTPEERLNHLNHIFNLNIEFNIPHNNITFLEDGVYFLEKVSIFINCGPCCSVTLYSIFESLSHGGKMITVGANEDGSALGINQKQTDGGVLKDFVWNQYIETFKLRDKITFINLDVNISRYILLPNPLIMSGEYRHMPESCFHDMVITTAMFICSRPPAKFAKKVNDGNSTIGLQLFPNIMDFEGTPEFKYGLSLIELYNKGCVGLEDVGISAAIPLMVTALMGGVYKEGQFGFSPTDKHAKATVSCITEESLPVFIANIRKLYYLTPGYDLLAVILAK